MTRRAVGLAASLALMAGAAVSERVISLLEFSDLPGWAEDDHAGALAAFTVTCGDMRPADWGSPCAIAKDAPDARAFFELMFKPVRPLTDDEGTQVLPLLTDPKLERILAEAVEVTSRDTEKGTQDAPKADPLFEEPQPTKAKVAKPKVKVVEPPADDLSGDSALEQDIKGILDELGDLS